MNQQKNASILLALFFAIITFNSQNHVFFGDMVQFGSRHAHFFFEQNFSTCWLPTHLDSGHPPVFGMYMALCWKLFGKSLVVSHWAMFPFLLLIAFAIPRLIKNVVQGGSLIFISLLFFLEPTLRAQASLTSPDVVLIACFLWALVFYIEQKNSLLLLALIPMSFISMRGMMLLFAFYLATISHQYITNKKQGLKQYLTLTLIFTPAALLCFYWLFRHYQLSGWIGFHSDSPWASSFQTVSTSQIIKNLFLMIWRFIDFGRMTVFLFLLGFAFYQFRKKDSIKSHQLFLILLFVFLLLVYSANTLFADGLVGHRYYLPIYLIALLLVVQWIEHYFPNRAGILTSIVAFSFIFGSMFVYPHKIAMGWDATPAHKPYYKLRGQAIAYLEKNNIAINNVAAGFPSLDSREYLELNSDTSRFQSYHLNNTEYILWSNLFNYPDELQDSLALKKVIFEQEEDGVFMKIVER